MIRAHRFFPILLAIVAFPLCSAAQDAPSEYASLLASLKGGNTSIDYARLRLTWVDSPEY
jgi:hypothetical protein